MTIPTFLTLIRLPLTAAIIWLVLLPAWQAHAAALAAYVLAGATDWLDGYLARRWAQTTPLGALLDPIADKVLVLGLLASVAWLGLVPAWMFAVILARELLVTALRLIAARRRIILPAVKEGKQKAFLQMLTIGLILVWRLGQSWGGVPEAWLGALQGGVTVGLWLTVLLTLTSGVAFLRHYRL